jgi:ankyrin repeat protein
MESQLKIINILLFDFGADVDTADTFGNSALHYAMKNNDLQVVQFLLQKKPTEQLNNQ